MLKEISIQKIEFQKYKSSQQQILTCKNNLEKITTEINSISLSDRTFDIELDTISKKIKQLQENDKQHQHNHKEILKYLDYRKKLEDYQKWEEKVLVLKTEEKKLRHELDTYELFYKKILDAESIAISQYIDEINYYMNFYLDKFFPDNPITVQISPYKETKKDIKPIINIEVGYKGVDMELNSLSGGEYDRVALSIVLALNTIFGSNLLMLDESISSLDSELLNDILEILKENLPDKLVFIVAHQINEGIFDDIIKVQEK